MKIPFLCVVLLLLCLPLQGRADASNNMDTCGRYVFLNKGFLHTMPGAEHLTRHLLDSTQETGGTGDPLKPDAVALAVPSVCEMRSSPWDGIYILEGADPGVFQVLSVEYLFGKSGRRVYHRDKQINGLDGTGDLEIYYSPKGAFYFKNRGKISAIFNLEGFWTQLRPVNAASFNPHEMTRVWPGEHPALAFTNGSVLTDGKNNYVMRPAKYDRLVAVKLEQNMPLDWYEGRPGQDQPCAFADLSPQLLKPLPPHPGEFIKGDWSKSGRILYANRFVTNKDRSFPDIDTFTVLEFAQYAKDKNRVYYLGREVEGADPRTFTAIHQRWGKDKKHVYVDGKPVPGADPRSIAVIDPERHFVKDKNAIYDPYRGRIIPTADPASFKLTGPYGKDKQQVWLMEGKATFTLLPGVKSKNFKLLAPPHYATDGRLVVYMDTVIEGADAGSFKADADWPEYSRDKAHVYYKGKSIPGADPATFAVHAAKEADPTTGGRRIDFCSDKASVYIPHWYMPKKLDGAEPSSFVRVNSDWAYDTRMVWFLNDSRQGMPVPGMSPEGFTVLPDGQGLYVKNRDMVLFQGKVIEKATPDSFRLLTPQWGVDGDKAYYNGALCEGTIEPGSFAPIPATGKDGDPGYPFHRATNLVSMISETPQVYAKDKKHVWLKTEIIKTADARSFEHFPYSFYGKDKKTVYFLGTPLPDADHTSFKPVSPEHAEDARGFFKGVERVSGPVSE